MFRKISRDIKISAIHLYKRNLLPLHDILDCCSFSKWTWYRIMHLWNTTGNVLPPRASLHGCVHNLDRDDLGYLLVLVRQNPDYFLDELLHPLETNRFISVHYVTIHRELEQAGISSKKLKKIALEHNEERRAAFISRMAQYAPEEIRFLNEFSKDARSVGRWYGRARKGRHAEKKQHFVWGCHTSTEGLLTLDGVVSGTVVEGSMTKRGFLQYLEIVIVSFCMLLVFDYWAGII